MSFAVVVFNDKTASEIPKQWLIERNEANESDFCWWPPSSVKNIRLLITKAIPPDSSTWQKLPVNVEKIDVSLEKARKFAEDADYTSSEDLCIGRGFRKHQPKVFSGSSSESEEEIEPSAKKAHFVKKMRIEHHPLPVFQNVVYTNNDGHSSSICKKQNNFSQANPSTSNKVIDTINNFDEHFFQKPHAVLAKEKSFSESNSFSPNKDYGTLTNIDSEENRTTHIILRKLGNMQRSLSNIELRMDDFKERLDAIVPIVNIRGPTEAVTKHFPLTTTAGIQDFNNQLLNEEHIQKCFKTFVNQVGGHSPQENVKNILAKIFSNQLAQECSWKGRKNNFAIGELFITDIIKEEILRTRAPFQEVEFVDVASTWFRFAKQRFTRSQGKKTQDNEPI